MNSKELATTCILTRQDYTIYSNTCHVLGKCPIAELEYGLLKIDLWM